MAYRRKQGPQLSLTSMEDTRSASSFSFGDDSSLPSPQLAAYAIRASAAHDDSSSLSSAYGHFSSPPHRNSKQLTRSATYATPKDAATYEYTSMKSLNEDKYGFWGVLARKAKSILEDDNTSQQIEDHGRSRLQMLDTSAVGQFDQPNHSPDSYQKSENPSLDKGSESISSIHNIGGSIKKCSRRQLTSSKKHERLQIRRESGSFSARNQPTDLSASNYLYPNLNDYEPQLKASRDIRLQMQWLPRPSFFCES